MVWHGHRHERAQAFGLGLGLGFGEAAGVEAPAVTGLSDDTVGKPRAAAEEVLRGTEASVGDGGEPAECAEDWNSCAAGKWWPPLPVLLRPLDVATQAGTCFAPVKLDDVRERMPAFVARPRAEDLQEDCTPLAAADSDDDGGAQSAAN